MCLLTPICVHRKPNLKKIVCRQAKNRGINNCNDARLLPLTVAAFKTPILRDLGHSASYMHTGQFTNLQEAVGFYITSSNLAKTGQPRNAAPELRHVNLANNDVELFVAFIKALNEDYE